MTPIVPKSTTPVITTSSGRKRGDFYLDFSKPPEPMGKIELPDGKIYDVAPLQSGEVIRIEELREEQTPDSEAMPVYAAICHRVTGAPMDVIYQLTPMAAAHLVMAARFGVQRIAELLEKTAADVGASTDATPAVAPKPARRRAKG